MSKHDGETPEERAARKQRKAERRAKRAAESAADPAPEPVAAAAESSEPPRKKAKRASKADAAPAASTASTAPAASTASTAAFFAEHSIAHEPESAAAEFPALLSFAALPVSDALRNGLSAFTTPTPVQSAGWPVLLAGRDTVAIAETGSGKTLGFGVPALNHVLSLGPAKKSKKKGAAGSKPAVLVIAPTRELAIQTHDTLSALGAPLGIGAVCVYGGVDKGPQRAALEAGARIVSGTPGRLLDLAGQDEVLDLSEIGFLVLDEADRMLERGFLPELRQIIGLCGRRADSEEIKPRQTALYSATWPQEVRAVATEFLRQPVRVTVGSEELSASANVAQSVRVIADPKKKDGPLLDSLKESKFDLQSVGLGPTRDKVLVFALYKKEAQRVHDFLARKGFAASVIQGDMHQHARSAALSDFKTGKTAILVATDVAARGLDIPKVEFVLNYTFPLTIEDYVHRIGRTGRAGRKGRALTFFTEDDKAHAGELQRVLREGNHEIPEALKAFGSVIKKATHGAYGSHFRTDIGGTATKKRFD